MQMQEMWVPFLVWEDLLEKERISIPVFLSGEYPVFVQYSCLDKEARWATVHRV